MFDGRTIEELINIVAKAEEHARETRMAESPRLDVATTPFVYERPPAMAAMIGVA